MGVTVRFWKGAWWVFVNTAGHRKAKRIGDRETALRVAQALREKMSRDALHLPAVADGRTLRAYAATWLATATGALKASTLRFYEGHLEQHIYPALGSRPVASLRRQDCRALVAGCRAKGLRVATVRGVVRALSTVLTQAVEDELLAGNPALRMGRYLREGDEATPQIQPFTREEASTLLATASLHFPRWHPLLLSALRTGLRQGELIALQWADIDFASRFIAVNRNYVRGVITTPKNHRRRRVDMSAQLVETLAALRLRQKAKALKNGTPAPALVFPSRLDTLLDDANVRHIFERILERAELRRIRFHDLRHTFASLLIQQGESLTYVKEQMGHSSIQVTVDVYGHLVPGGNRAAVDRLDDVQPSATPAQPDEKIAVGEKAVSALERVVTQTFASWNQIGEWLRRIEKVRQAA